MKCRRFDGFGKLKLEVKNKNTDTKQYPYQPGALFWGVNCLVLLPTQF